MFFKCMLILALRLDIQEIFCHSIITNAKDILTIKMKIDNNSLLIFYKKFLLKLLIFFLIWKILLFREEQEIFHLIFFLYH